ncbi:unnamed protein product [Psylliodes chrysocephalus]|uniref:Uncharacterized protein n=1 Tax=Psylliodes chrysocephalus TaxID=3402493 RepID=A0A9P0D6T2_9CUCU|nr:unnamed protein product [Psylliodes chrysocephala]
MSSSDPNRDIEKSSENITETSEDDNPEKYVYETVLNIILKELDVVKEGQEEDTIIPEEIRKNVYPNVESKTMLIPLDNSTGIYVNTSSLLVRKQDKASEPGIIFGTAGKSVLNLDDKCPPIPYCEMFEDKSFQESKIVLYAAPNYVVPLYDDTGQRLPPAAVDGDITRKKFILKVIIILSIQLLYTVIFILPCIYIKPFGNFMKGTILFIVMFSMDIILYLIIHFWELSRKKKPYNYILLGTFTFCSAYPLGYFHAEFDSAILLLVTIFGTITLLLVLGLLSFLNVCHLSPRSYVVINVLLILIFILFVIILIGLWTTRNIFLTYIFLCIYLPIESFFILHLFQLLLGRAGSHVMKTDEHVLTSVMFYIHINTILIISVVLMEGPYYKHAI